jgi:peptidoglycan L-alanyl-D-glutamate endopeptidase CwlK
MTYVLGSKSKEKLKGVNTKLVRVVEHAITISKQDFSVIEGLRTLDRQKQLVAAKKSQTMSSKHITGNAVDLAAYVDGTIEWQLHLFDEIADAMKQAAIKEGVSVRWGAAWNIPDIRVWDGSLESAMMHYVDTRRSQGRRPFIDAPHFELS